MLGRASLISHDSSHPAHDVSDPLQSSRRVSSIKTSTNRFSSGFSTKPYKPCLNRSDFPVFCTHIFHFPIYVSDVSTEVQQTRMRHCVRHEEVANKLVLWQPTDGHANRERQEITYVDNLLKDKSWETQVNCRQSRWTEGAGRAVCSTTTKMR